MDPLDGQTDVHTIDKNNESKGGEMNDTNADTDVDSCDYVDYDPPVTITDDVNGESDESDESDEEDEIDTGDVQESDAQDTDEEKDDHIVDDVIDSAETIESLASESSILDERSVNGYDYLLKVIVIGNSCVGKSNLTLRFTKDDFEIENETTIGVEFATRLVCLDSNVYKLQIWDTAGQDTFKSITRSYYRNSLGVIVAYDISNRESFDAVRGWIEEVMERSEPYTGMQSIIIVGNKADRTSDRQVLTSEGENLASEFGFKFYETSAKTGENVNDIFCHIVADVNQKIKTGKLEFKKNEGISLVPVISESYYSNCSC